MRLFVVSLVFVGAVTILACGDDEDANDGAPSNDTDAGSADGGGSGGDGGASLEAAVGEAGASAGTKGCGAPTTIATAAWIKQALTLGSTSREYSLWLPKDYDEARKYPVVYQFHGCSDAAERQNNNPPVEKQSGADAIVVRGRAAASCWDTAEKGPDFAYADAMIASVESSFCVDPSKRFGAGYSSGSFMVHSFACSRDSLFRGVASIAGGQRAATCPGKTAALLIHDLNDTTVKISASEQTRDRYLADNACNATATRTPFAPAPCESYAGCTAGLPVVWCQTSGKNHDRQDALSAPAFWNFFSSLPAR